MDRLSRVTPATLDVLATLLDAPEDIWGLEIVKATGRPSGSVYPILDRLERAGWVASRWEQDTQRRGPRRRLYRLLPGARVGARRLCRERGAAPRQSERSRRPAVRPAARLDPLG